MVLQCAWLENKRGGDCSQMADFQTFQMTNGFSSLTGQKFHRNPEGSPG